MQRRTVLLLALILAAAWTAGVAAAPFSKTFQFKSGVILEIGATSPEGLRIDSVQFFPAESRKNPFRFGDPMRADVAISNLSSEAQKIGIAIALFDAQGRLVGVASGGSKLLAIKSERQSSYSLSFHDLNNDASRASSFQISVEIK